MVLQGRSWTMHSLWVTTRFRRTALWWWWWAERKQNLPRWALNSLQCLLAQYLKCVYSSFKFSVSCICTYTFNYRVLLVSHLKRLPPLEKAQLLSRRKKIYPMSLSHKHTLSLSLPSPSLSLLPSILVISFLSLLPLSHPIVTILSCWNLFFFCIVPQVLQRPLSLRLQLKGGVHQLPRPHPLLPPQPQQLVPRQLLSQQVGMVVVGWRALILRQQHLVDSSRKGRLLPLQVVIAAAAVLLVGGPRPHPH